MSYFTAIYLAVTFTFATVSLDSKVNAAPLPANRTTLKLQPEKQSQVNTNGSKSESVKVNPIKPFSVKIGNLHYYGGLATYTHVLHSARICRVMNGCVKSDGTLLLPEWMQRHDDILSFHCGHTKVEFSLNDTQFPSDSLSTSYDLIGLPPASHPSMPLFVKQFMPSAVIFDLLYGTHDRVSRACHSRRGQSCKGFPRLDSVKALVLMPDRLKDLELKRSWPKQFVNLMKPPGTGRLPRMIYESDLFTDDVDDQMKCFRSAMFTRGPFNKNVIMNDHLKHIHFLSLHGVDRRSRKIWSGGNTNDPNNLFAKYQLETATNARRCILNVTIANRDPTKDKRRVVGRFILNANAMRQAIIKHAKRIPGLDLHVQHLTMEGKTLRWQMNAMQKTDILIAAHGPLLTNMIFLRENTSSVIEIQPFAYYPNTYEQQAEFLAHINHQRYISHPDYRAFHACISQSFSPHHAFRAEALNILHKFSLAVDKYRKSDSTHSYVLHNLNTDNNLYHRRVLTCAKMQRINVDENKFATAVVRTARLTCGLPLPTTPSKTLAS